MSRTTCMPTHLQNTTAASRTLSSSLSQSFCPSVYARPLGCSPRAQLHRRGASSTKQPKTSPCSIRTPQQQEAGAGGRAGITVCAVSQGQQQRGDVTDLKADLPEAELPESDLPEAELPEEHESVAEVSDALQGFYDTRFFKLVDLGEGEATLEIDGVQMHITKSKKPSQDAKDKVRLARVRKGSRVLDVCTGLGYSALAAARTGAAEVITIEKEPSVLEVARQNPSSDGLFTHPAIRIVNDNAFDAVRTFPDSHFGSIMHDPPRLSHAGELYSQEFYCQLYRLLRSGGRLFHYTGSPGSKSGKNVPGGIKGRLTKAGFVEVKWVEGCQGFSASKY